MTCAPHRRLALLAVACALASPSCRKHAPRAVHVPEMAQGFDDRAIDAQHLDEDSAARHHVLNMGTPELCARLKGFVLRTQTTISLSQSSREVLQQSHAALLAQDAQGSIHLQSGDAKNQLELYAVGARAYVRQDRGHMRHKRRQEMEIPEMVEAGAASLRQMLQHFPGVTLTSPQAVTHDGRPAVRYSLDMSGAADPTLTPQPSLRALPIAAPSRWREEAKNQHIDGQLVVDVETGAVLRAEAKGTMTLPGHDGPPYQLALRCQHTLAEVNRTATIREPQNSIAEFRRPLRPHDPLSFDRSAQLPSVNNARGPANAPAEAPSEVPSDAPADGPPPEDSPLDDAP